MRVAVIVNGPPASGKSTLAPALAAELGLPLLAKDEVKESMLDRLSWETREDSRRIGATAGQVVWQLLALTDEGAVVESWLDVHLRDLVADRLSTTGVDAAVEVWCEAAPDVVGARYAGRDRHPGHFDHLLDLDEILERAEPLGVAPVLRVRTDEPVDVPALADDVRRLLHPQR